MYCPNCRLPASPPPPHVTLGRPIDHRLTDTFGCRWRAAHSHGQHRATARRPSEAGALRACRLPIAQRAMTGTGLRAMSRQISGNDCSALACDIPLVMRLFFRQSCGVHASVHDAVMRCPSRGQTGIRRVNSSLHPGGVSV